MGKNKKQTPNAFSCFMNDFAKQQGRKFKNMKEVAEAAAPHWKNLSAEQRKIYEEQAKGAKEKVKYTSQGLRVDVILEQENQVRLKEQEMRSEIQSLVKCLLETNRIQTHMFHIIHINHFCYCNSTKRFIPAELAIVRFNLQDGVIEDNILHFTIKPGPLPLGYAATAKAYSEVTHQLPVPFCDEEDNCSIVIEAIFKFLRIGLSATEQKFPPLFCDEKPTEVVENVIKNFLLDYGCSQDMISIYSLEFLFYTLRNELAGAIVWPSISLSVLELERDVFDYCKGISCEFHEESDVPKYCSRSRVIRFSYIICQNCCSDLKIDVIPGQHVPANAIVVNAASVQQPDSCSLYSDFQGDSHCERLEFMSARSESGLTVSSFSEHQVNLSTEFNSDLSQGNQSSDWQQAKSRKKRNERAYESSVVGSFPSGFTESEPVSFTSAASSQSRQLRRPAAPPAALGPQFAQMSLRDDQRSTEEGSVRSAPMSRGRGRGSMLWAKMKQKN